MMREAEDHSCCARDAGITDYECLAGRKSDGWMTTAMRPLHYFLVTVYYCRVLSQH